MIITISIYFILIILKTLDKYIITFTISGMKTITQKSFHITSIHKT